MYTCHAQKQTWALHVRDIYKVCAFESTRNNLCCQTLAAPGHFQVALLINGSFRSATLHIPQEVAGPVVGVRLFIIFQTEMSLGTPLELLTSLKCPLLMGPTWSKEFKGVPEAADLLWLQALQLDNWILFELHFSSTPCWRQKWNVIYTVVFEEQKEAQNQPFCWVLPCMCIRFLYQCPEL